jgi:NhaP-type Na+/H+ or K+/H+ antiporter
VFLLIIFFIGEAAMEKFKPRFGHHTCLVVIFGFIFALILFFILGPSEAENNPELLLATFVPLIIFSLGFNLR